MSTKRYKAEQIVTVLRQIEVEIAWRREELRKTFGLGWSVGSALGSGLSPICVLPGLFRPGNPWRLAFSGLPKTRLIAFRLCYRPRYQPKIGDQRSLAHFSGPGGRFCLTSGIIR